MAEQSLKDKTMEIKSYAPVVIPTLNRYEHFKQCLESLERCIGADKTEVYVGLDYPPNDKYVNGWNQVDMYLKEKEINNGFKKLKVTRRTHNCGVLVDGSNEELLINEALENYDRYIFTEDDNVFSPCFLEYMNSALEKYKDEIHIRAICGYTHPEFYRLSNANIQCVIDTPAYGYGCWRESYDYLYERKYGWVYLELKKSKRRTISLFWRYPALIYMCVSMVWARLNSGDLRFSLFNLMNNTYSICPSVSLVRNIGADGSGLHSGYVPERENQEILTQEHFIMDDIEINKSKKHDSILFNLNMPKGFFPRHLCLIQRFFVVVLFLLFDSRNNADEPYGLFLRVVNKAWDQGRNMKRRIYEKTHKAK